MSFISIATLNGEPDGLYPSLPDAIMRDAGAAVSRELSRNLRALVQPFPPSVQPMGVPAAIL